jgi:hypothetical protein
MKGLEIGLWILGASVVEFLLFFALGYAIGRLMRHDV